MYVGGIKESTKTSLFLEKEKFIYKDYSSVDGLMKIIAEVLDNSVDEAIRTNFDFANKISIQIKNETIIIEDNGRGLPQSEVDGVPQAVIAFTEARAGSNFSEDTKAAGIGTNGIGSYLSNVYSTSFIVETSNGKNKIVLKSKDNAESFDYKISKSTSQGTKVTFTPDLGKFGVTSISEIYQSLLKQRLYHLAVSFPKVQFKFNGKQVKVNSSKSYINMFDTSHVMVESDNFLVAILPNEYDDFRQFSYVNGIDIKTGGSHIEFLLNNIVPQIKEKLVKKFPTLKPGDIKNKLRLVVIMKEFKDLSFDSQTKEKVTNSTAEMREYFDIDFEKITKKVLAQKDIIDPITEMYRLKEELAKRKLLAKGEKKVKKIVSDKYFAPSKKYTYLMIEEGYSATSALMSIIGRENIGHLSLKGKPMNVLTSSDDAIYKNPEVQLMLQVMGLKLSEAGDGLAGEKLKFDYVVFATDADSDGILIRGLLLSFFYKYFPELIIQGRVCFLDTPAIIGFDKKENIVELYEQASDFGEATKGIKYQYIKGLGTLDQEIWEKIKKDNKLEDFIVQYEAIDDWESQVNIWNGENPDLRKEQIAGISLDLYGA